MTGRTPILALLLFLPLTIMAEGGKSQVPLADPYILLDGDTYYAYGTNDANGIRCYTSEDLRLWKYEGLALNKSNTTETKNFWAPEVYHVKGKYIMYYSANEHLYAATSTSPKGPFVQVGSYQMKDVLPTNENGENEKCIDSHVFFDVKSNGDTIAYIFFVRFTDGNCIWQAKLDDDFITPVASTLRKCFAASQSWELKQGRVNEGPNVIKYRNTYYLTYSGNDYRCQDYAVGYATTSNIASGSWTKYASNPILRRWDDLVGTGHHSLFYDKDGNLRIVFHAHNDTANVQTRRMYIGTMKFQSNRLVMLNDPIIRPTLSTTAPYSPELITPTWGFQDGGAVTVDLNNDGHQDIVAGGLSSVQNSATGEATTNQVSYLALFGTATHKWTKVSTAPAFKVTDSPSFVPCDINNDGWMDIIAFDQRGSSTSEDNIEGIFLGKGNGTFEEAGLQLPFDIKAPCNAEVIDIDNDGRLDIILVGHQDETSYNVILHNQTTDAGLAFSVEPYDQEFLLREAIIKPADFNNDGLQDFVISAAVDGREDQLRFTDIFLNNPEQIGHFNRLGLGERDGDIKRKSNGALQVADFNNDGWLDIMLAGLGEASSGESGQKQRIYINQKTEVPSFKAIYCDFQTDIYTLSSSSSNSAGVIDWNGDGLYDALIGGTKSGTYGGMLYLNDGRGRLKRSVAIPGALGACTIFPDYNGDGRKDFVLIGETKDKSYLTEQQYGNNAILCYNLLTTPSRPDAPLAPTFDKQNSTVTLSWQAPETAHSGFTYEVFIKDESGSLINSTPAIVGGTNDGIRKANLLGRVGTRTEWTFYPTKAGTYSWGVQTVDAAYNGSSFTEGPQFTVTEEDIASGLKAAPSQLSRGEESVFNLAGQHLPKVRKGVNIRQGKKIIH